MLPATQTNTPFNPNDPRDLLLLLATDALYKALNMEAPARAGCVFGAFADCDLAAHYEPIRFAVRAITAFYGDNPERLAAVAGVFDAPGGFTPGEVFPHAVC